MSSRSQDGGRGVPVRYPFTPKRHVPRPSSRRICLDGMTLRQIEQACEAGDVVEVVAENGCVYGVVLEVQW